MEKGFEKEEPADEKILKTLDEIEAEKEQKLVKFDRESHCESYFKRLL